MQRQYFDTANVIHQQEQQHHQMLYAQQTATTNNNTAAAIVEAIQPHEMPTPTAEPWNVELMPWKLENSNVVPADGVMKFSANRNNYEVEALQRRLQLHHKRKSDIMAEHPPKQFITEEKFTAHFNGLHISSDYVQHNSNTMSSFNAPNLDDKPSTSGICFTNRTYQDYQITARELENKLRRANRITICDEVKRLHEEQKKISFLPEALMNRIEKPCKALVLWQPSPIDILRQVNVESNQNTENKFVYKNVRLGNEKEPRNMQHKIDDYDEFSDAEPDVEIDDYIDNNNTSSLDFNNLKPDGMDEDL